MTKGVHRVPAGSKTARKLMHAKGARLADEIRPVNPGEMARLEEQKRWNAELEQKRKARRREA